MASLSIENNAPELMQKVEAATSRFVRKAATHVKDEIKSSMAEPKTGRKYKRDGITHIASAPNESPANDSGDYEDSLKIIFENSLEAKIGTSLDYPNFLEDGTDEIEPRPLWEKTFDQILPTLENLLEDELRRIN